MENYPITISKNKQVHHFEVGEYLHHDEKSCKYKVFEQGQFVASLSPTIGNFSMFAKIRAMLTKIFFIPWLKKLRRIIPSDNQLNKNNEINLDRLNRVRAGKHPR